jgi:hypothetical protein
MDSTPSTRSRNRSPRVPPTTSTQNRSVAQPSAALNGSTQDWTEPALASPIPSFEDHGGGPYGVLEDMQPLGSRPTAKVRGRVKPDAPKKSALGKSVATPIATTSNQGTPEATPVPMDPLPEQPLVIVDDERDDDYTPRPSKKPAKGRLPRSAANTVKSTASPKPTTPSVATSETPVPSSVATPFASATPTAAPTDSAKKSRELEVIRQLDLFDQAIPLPSSPHQLNLHNIVKAAVRKSIEVGNKYLGLAIQEVYLDSFSKPWLVDLLDGILDQTSTPEEILVFREHISQAKKKIKAKELAVKKKKSASEVKKGSSLAPEMIPHPSIETQAVPRKLKISLKNSGKKATQSVTKPAETPAPPPQSIKKPRTSSVSSSSSLSSLTSIEEEMPLADPLRSSVPAITPAMLSAPPETNGVKRSSMEAGNDEADREFQAKKQKFDKSVNRDAPTEESHIRPDLLAMSSAHQGLIVPPIHLTANGVHSKDSPVGGVSSLTNMSSPLSSASRDNTPKRASMPAKMMKKKAKTKHS